MFIPCSFDRASLQRDRRLLRNDLCAQLAPLNRYGLAGFSSALVDRLRALFGAARSERDRQDCCAHC
jgi:hypothetical protein